MLYMVYRKGLGYCLNCHYRWDNHRLINGLCPQCGGINDKQRVELLCEKTVSYPQTGQRQSAGDQENIG